MKSIRGRLTYANVMSSLAVFLVLGGATAFAASNLAKNSVGPKQLKANAVTTAKIKKGAVTALKLGGGAVGGGALANGAVSADKIANGAVTGDKLGSNSVTGAKIASGAVTGDKIAPGSISGAAINVGSTPFSQVVARIRGNTPQALTTTPALYPLSNPTFTQAAGENDSVLGALDVVFPAGCTQPRSATAYLVGDSPTPATLNTSYIVGVGVLSDTNTGTTSRRVQIGPYPGFPSTFFEDTAPSSHTLTLWVFGTCTAGSGINAIAGAVDVIGTK
jgi:hypothetical protein